MILLSAFAALEGERGGGRGEKERKMEKGMQEFEDRVERERERERKSFYYIFSQVCVGEIDTV